jgi:ribosome-associated protein
MAGNTIEEATSVAPSRRPTKPARGSQRRRVESKIKRGQTKSARRKITGE